MDKNTWITNAFQAAKVARLRGAPINPVIATAQAALESAFGTSELATKGNNLFGMKAGSSWQGKTLSLPTKEWSPERGWYETTAVWRKYPDWEVSFEDYGMMIGRLPWYADAVTVRDDPLAYLKALVNRDEPAYATDPAYIEKVWSIVEQYGLLNREPDSNEPEFQEPIYHTLVEHEPLGDPDVTRRPFALTIRGGKVDVRYLDKNVPH